MNNNGTCWIYNIFLMDINNFNPIIFVEMYYLKDSFVHCQTMNIKLLVSGGINNRDKYNLQNI
jgi:hypothetical protein